MERQYAECRERQVLREFKTTFQIYRLHGKHSVATNAPARTRFGELESKQFAFNTINHVQMIIFASVKSFEAILFALLSNKMVDSGFVLSKIKARNGCM